VPAVTNSELGSILAAARTKFKLLPVARWASTPTGQSGLLAHDATILAKSPCLLSDSEDKLAPKWRSSRRKLVLLLDALIGLSGATGEHARLAAALASENVCDDARARRQTV